MPKNILQKVCDATIQKGLTELEIEGSEINIGLNTQLVDTLNILELDSELSPKVLSLFKMNLKQTGSNLLFSMIEDLDCSNLEAINLAATTVLVQVMLESIQQALEGGEF